MMELTEKDPVLSMCGEILAKTGMLPTDDRFRELLQNPSMAQFTVHWLRKRESDIREFFMRTLGVYWTYEDLMSKGDPSNDMSELFIPLAVAVNPDMMDVLRKTLKPKVEGVVDLGKVPLKEHLEVVTRIMSDIKGVLDAKKKNV